MSSDIQICNRGLSWVGIQRITSLTGNGAAEQACNLHFADNRDLLLAMFPWSFATIRTTLALLVTNPRSTEWLYAYQRPTNTLRIKWVNDASVARAQTLVGEIASAPYELSEDTIFSDVPNAVAETTKSVTDASLFPPSFQNALSWMMARDVVVSMTEDSGRANRASQGADAAIERAMADDAAMNIQHDEQAPGWITYRGAGDHQIAEYDPSRSTRR